MTLGNYTVNIWWRARSARERGLLVLLAVIVLAFVGWYGVASPLHRVAERSEMHRAAAAALLSEVEASRATIGRMAIPTDTSLDEVLALSAAEAGFILEEHSEVSARETTIQGHAPQPAALFVWLEMLRRNHGLIVTNLTAARDDDGALRVEVVLVRSQS